MEDDFVANALTIGSLIASFFTAYLFHRIQVKQARSAMIERAARARAELVELVEQQIVNRSVPTASVIQTLISGSEREYQVQLERICSPVSLVEDVAFRLQRSSHLDVQQKDDFQKVIDECLARLREPGVNLPRLIVSPEHLSKIEAAAQGNNREDLVEAISSLVASKVGEPSLNSHYKISDRFSLGLAIIATICSLLLYSEFLGQFSFREFMAGGGEERLIAVLLLYAFVIMSPGYQVLNLFMGRSIRGLAGARESIAPNSGPQADV